MSHYECHYSTAPAVVTWGDLQAALQALDPKYSIVKSDGQGEDEGTLLYRKDAVAYLGLSRSGSSDFAESLADVEVEIKSSLESAGDSTGAQEQARALLAQIPRITAVISAQVPLDLKLPLKRWLRAWERVQSTAPGFSCDDDGGFWSGKKRLLP